MATATKQKATAADVQTLWAEVERTHAAWSASEGGQGRAALLRERDELLARRELGDQVDKALDDIDQRIDQVKDRAGAARGLAELYRAACTRWARARVVELEEQRRETRQAAQVLRDEAARLLREAQHAAGMAQAREDTLHPLAAKIRRLTVEAWVEAEREIARNARRG